MAAHRAAVRAGLAYLDTHAALSRRGTDGVEQIARRAGGGGARPPQQPSRGPAAAHPRLVLNKVRCADGRWRTLDATELCPQEERRNGLPGSIAQRDAPAPRRTLREADENGQADIAGVPDALLDVVEQAHRDDRR
jgi:hypothetical protein